MSSVLETIKRKINQALTPSYLDVIDESHNHSRGVNTHYRVVTVADIFEGKRLPQRHQLIYKALANELNSGVHALAIHTFTPAEWQEKNQQVTQSPACRGGSKWDKL